MPNKKKTKKVESEGQDSQSEETPKTVSKAKKTSKASGSKTAKNTKSKAPAKGKGSKQSGGKSTKGKKASARYFKLINEKTSKSYGRYTGDTPKQAASKGYTKMLQKMKENGKTPPKQSTIYLRESTRGSARKVYGYVAYRQKLPEPQKRVIIDKESGEKKTIICKYRNRIKKAPVPEQLGGMVKSKKSAGKSSKKSPANRKKETKSDKKKTASKGSKTAKKETKKTTNKKTSPKVNA